MAVAIEEAGIEDVGRRVVDSALAKKVDVGDQDLIVEVAATDESEPRSARSKDEAYSSMLTRSVLGRRRTNQLLIASVLVCGGSEGAGKSPPKSYPDSAIAASS